MNMHIKEQCRIIGDHVKQVVEEGCDDGHSNVDNHEEYDHFDGSPQWFQQLAYQDNDGNVYDHLPNVNLQKAMRERGPYPKVRGPEVLGRDAQNFDGGAPEGEDITDDNDDTERFDSHAGIGDDGQGFSQESRGNGGDGASHHGFVLQQLPKNDPTDDYGFVDVVKTCKIQFLPTELLET